MWHLNDLQSQIAIGLAVAFVIWMAGLFPKGIKWAIENWRQAKIAAYITATSFDEREILDSLNNYVKPECMEIDPACTPEMRDALTFPREDLFRRVDQFIDSGKCRHLFIFADCGMGKTSFLINYFHRNRSQFFSKKRNGMSLVSLSRASAQDEIERVPVEKRKQTILLLDALDEDPLVFGDTEGRISRLLSISGDFKAVVITCRSQFFENDDSIPVKTGITRVGPTKASESKELDVEKLYVAPFDDRKIKQYLKKQFPGVINIFRRKRAARIVERVPSLTVRPMLLAHIADVIAESSDVSTQADIYQAMVSAWVKREDRWIKQKPLLDFSKSLAFDLYINRHERGGEYCHPPEIARLAEAWGTDIKTEHLTGRSLLNRLGDGNFKFSHRSILEFFVAESIISSPSGLTIEITDQMTRFLMQRLRCADGSAEEILARRSIRVSVVAPEVRLGYATNYGLYRSIPALINPAGVFGINVISHRELFESRSFGEHLQSALMAAGARRFSAVRLNVPRRSRDTEYVDAYLSVWFGDLVILSNLKVSSRDLQSVLARDWSDLGEVCLVGTPHRTQTIESVRWERQTRCDMWAGNSLDVRTLERCPAISFFHIPEEKFISISFISSGERVGPLGSFGIVSGGSSLSLETQAFLRLPEVSHSPVAEIKSIRQEEARVATSELWPTKKR